MKNIFTLTLLLLSAIACTPDGSKNTSLAAAHASNLSLSDQQIQDYIKVFNQLKQRDEKVLELMNENDVAAYEQTSFAAIEKIIQENGFSLDDYVAISSKIGTIYSISEANMDTYQEISNTNINQMQDVANSIQEMIDDPDIPESNKAMLREQLAEAQKGKMQIANMWEQNKEKAAKMYKQIQKKIGKIATTQEIELVNKYQKELEAAYEGIGRPRIEGSL